MSSDNNTSYTINKAMNGYIVEKTWYEEDSTIRWHYEKSVFSVWEDAVNFVLNNPI